MHNTVVTHNGRRILDLHLFIRVNLMYISLTYEPMTTVLQLQYSKFHS